jgi:hypothetical protein
MTTELDIDAASFDPKLCVTASLDGASGVFTVVLTEGRSIADYQNPVSYEQTNIRNGEIRLYEDGHLIFSEAGEFDMTVSEYNPHLYEYDPYYQDDGQRFQPKSGYRFETRDMATRSGSVYRLEVEVDGYATVASSSVMPSPPDVTAAIDTFVFVRKENITRYSTLGAGFTYWGGYGFHPVALQWNTRPEGRNYYALEMCDRRTTIEGTPDDWRSDGLYNSGVYVENSAKVQDSPEIEIFASQVINSDFDLPEPVDLYGIPVLLMSDIGLTPDNASLTLYRDVERSESMDEDAPWYQPGMFEKFVQRLTVTLRVKQITEATFRYYRSLVLQESGTGIFFEPVTIAGNIENGYGGFSVSNSVDFQLLDYEVTMYRYIQTYPPY